MNRRFSPLNNEQGYSLIELLVGLVIFTIAMTAILSMVLSSIRGNALTQSMTEARFHAQGKLEELLNEPVADLVDGNDTSDDGRYRLTWTVTPGPTASSRWVEVRANWDDKGPHEIELRTMTRDNN